MKNFLPMFGLILGSIFYPIISPAQGHTQTITITNSGRNKLSDKAGANWIIEAEKYLSESEYYFQQRPGNLFASINRKQQTDFLVTAGKFTTQSIALNKLSPSWNTSLELIAISKKANDPKAIYTNPSVQIKEKYLSFAYDNFLIEYINDEKGLRQNFIIEKKPAGNQHLQVSLNISGNLSPKLYNNNSIEFIDPVTHKTVLTYDGLTVWDAKKTPLVAYMQLEENHLQLIVDDKNAVYPITIDPLSHTPEWTASADAVLPGLLNSSTLQANAMLGYTVEGVGDVNGDGYDDVAIGAPGAINIVGASTFVNAGAVFVYFGSSTGLSATPDKILRATSPVTSALFGLSIAGGNVVGNSQNDIIVGAPGDAYPTGASGFPATANVTAGKVYIFRGEDLASALPSPSPFLSIFLDGSGFFSNGILGIASNVGINALYGFSVGVADDLNGDGRGEVIVGSPGYASLGILAIRSGAAFVYDSTALANNTPVQLNPPAAGLLGIADLGGLLFGFSVDGAGDYNKDGKPDIVIGAPAGVTVLTNLLGGSAYVYYGNGTSVNTNFGTQLTAGGGLLGSIANLFGYKVRGVRNVSNNHTGNILVGAPNSSLLSNILGGLNLSSGSVNVFVAKPSPAASETPTQSITSPRSSSLLSILSGQNINVDALFGASMDNMLDVNCDGIGDIIVGEPLSTGVGLVNTNLVGGAAYLFTGKSDGTYNTTPIWTVENQVSADFGINAASMLGYSVAGAKYTDGTSNPVRALIGAPGEGLDFSSGIFNMSGTFSTLYNFPSSNDSLGKAYTFPVIGCTILPMVLTDFRTEVTDCSVFLNWSLATQTDLDHIEIEQSNDAATYTLYRKFTTVSTGNYSVNVPQQSATAYYRLKLVNKDQTYTYSNIDVATLNCTPANKLEVYPNPLRSGSTTILFSQENIIETGKASLTVMDINGKRLMIIPVTIITGTNTINMNCDQLPDGQYYIQIAGADWKSDALKFVKM
ncbi:MAG TPA: T9SS type A sorting domain-containing protein [Ferruginibacter sp.]|nr:T9SS type A sorting domain-containing protein [Ferruginibacter sp.]